MDRKSILWVLGLFALLAVLSVIMAPSSSPSSRDKSQQASGQQPGAAASQGGWLKESQLEYYQLEKLLGERPNSIKSLIVVNGTDQVYVLFHKSDKLTSVRVPDGVKPQLVAKATKNGVEVVVRNPTDVLSTPDRIIGTILSWLPTLLIFGLLIWLGLMLMRGIGGQLQGFGNSRGRKPKEKTEKKRLTWDDIAGCDEAVAEMRELGWILKDRKRFQRFKAKPPKGVLLVGPPGTGKTLLARILADQSDAAFREVSGSEFVEMFVGVGASRVRSLFADAEKNQPCILLVDEIDAVGRHRGTGIGHTNDEREQTLNQILTEMDGFDNTRAILVIACTNRPDVLDPALLRPGRFDRTIVVDKPDVKGRERIFRIHTRGMPLAADVSFEHLAHRTYGATGATIAASCNEAATLAARRYSEEVEALEKRQASEEEIARLPAEITLADFEEGICRIEMGVANTSRNATMSDEVKENTNVHELGHAILSEVEGDGVAMVSIVSRSRALGVTMSQPKEDRYGYTDEQLLSRIRICMAGRVAQKLFLNKIDTGAQNDFEQGTNIAYRMVASWGMSKLGPISVAGESEGPFLGRSMATGMGNRHGDKLLDMVDEEWQRIVKECYEETSAILLRNRGRMEFLRPILRRKETMVGPEWRELWDKYNSEHADEIAADEAFAQSHKGVETLVGHEEVADGAAAVLRELPGKASAEPATAEGTADDGGAAGGQGARA